MKSVLKAAAALATAHLALLSPAAAQGVVSESGTRLEAINCTSPDTAKWDEHFWAGFPIDSHEAAFQMAQGDVVRSIALARLKKIQSAGGKERRDVGAFSFGLPATAAEFEQWTARRDGLSFFNIFNAKTQAGFAEYHLSAPDPSTRQLQLNVWRTGVPDEEPQDGSGIIMRFAKSEVGNAWRLQAVHVSRAVPTQAYGLFAGIPFEELVARRAKASRDNGAK
ncbi:MAG: hypothetical protein ING59_10250 [Burkholderiales bacterium]|nr:hypothetical protein [Burkholderiales bacterium]